MLVASESPGRYIVEVHGGGLKADAPVHVLAAEEEKPKEPGSRGEAISPKPPSLGDVLRPCWLNSTLRPDGPRRPSQVISAYQKCVTETLQRFGGFVAKYMGDGVLVYFGYPQAHEDDAERAVRAGLDLVSAVNPPPQWIT
jgi:hypothetical protein